MSETRQILIVDDAEENVIYLSQILEDHGYPHRVARNGREAMEAMRESHPALVLLDIMMPRKGGLAVFHEMKKDPALESVPIIIVTGASGVTGVDIKTGEVMPKESYEDDLSRRFGHSLYEKLQGIAPDGLIEKPIDPPILMEKIRQLLD